MAEEESGEDRSERMRERMQGRFSSESEGGQNESSSVDDVDRSGGTESSDTSEPSQPSEPSEQSGGPATQELFATEPRLDHVRIDPVGNVKEEWNGNYIYLPEVLDAPLEDEFDRLRFQCKRQLSWKPAKNEHYYPVVFMDGLPAVERMTPEEFQQRVEELGLIE